jgi:ribonuclease HI
MPPPHSPRGPNDSEPGPRAPVFTGSHWTLFFDGSSRKLEGGAGILFLTPDGEQFKYMMHHDFKATNNMEEYEALIFRLSTTLSLGV